MRGRNQDASAWPRHTSEALPTTQYVVQPVGCSSKPEMLGVGGQSDSRGNGLRESNTAPPGWQIYLSCWPMTLIRATSVSRRRITCFPVLMSAAGLSCRRPTNFGWRRCPSRVHSTKATSATSAGFTQRSFSRSSSVSPSPPTGLLALSQARERILWRLERLQLAPDFRSEMGREAAPHFAGVAQLPRLVVADHQALEIPEARPIRRDHQLLPLQKLHLDRCVAPR